MYRRVVSRKAKKGYAFRPMNLKYRKRPGVMESSRPQCASTSKPRPHPLSLLSLCLSLCLSFLVFLAPHSHADVIAAMGAKEIRASRTLVGAVQAVRTERVLFVNPPGEPDTWIEDERILTAIAQYGKNGALTERTEYAPDGAVMVRAVRQYNQASKLSTEQLYNSQGALWRKTSHTYDETGRLTQAVSTDVDGDLWFRDVYTYTEDGQPAHIDHHDPDGTFLHRASFSYDGEGRIAKRALSDADGSPISSNTYVYDAEGRIQTVITRGRSGALTSRWTYAYDERGNEREWVESDTDGALQRKEVYTYEYDARGNWVKQVTLEWIPTDDGGYLEPAEAVHRTITYDTQAETTVTDRPAPTMGGQTGVSASQ